MTAPDKPRCNWKPPLSTTTTVFKELQVVGTKDVFVRGHAVVRIVDAEHQIIAECERMIAAEQIIKVLNKKFPAKKANREQ